MFEIFELDCVQTTSLYQRFVAIMAAPIVLVAMVQLMGCYKTMKLSSKKIRLVLGDRRVEKMKAKIDSDTTGRCLAAVFFLYVRTC